LRKQIMTIAQGTKVLSLSTGRVSKLKLNLPSLPEQQKIASFLSAVDEKIQQLSKKKALLEQYKKGGLQQLFSGQLRFKDENGNPYPDWEEKRLGDISDKVNKKNKDNSVNYVLTNSATQGIVSQSDYFDRDIANQNNLEGYYVVEVNDFVYNPRISVHAPVGPVKRNKLKEGVMSPLYTVFRFKDVDLIYLECFFSTIVWHKYLNSVANFGARHDRMNISQQDFFKMPIPFPCFEEQQKIARYLSSIDTKIEAVNNQITQTQTFKKGLLQQMFV
jgi:type I restriction enzyme S subunit